MAEPKYKHPLNAPGAYFVYDTCIDCDMCRTIAPGVFTRDETRALSYVHTQPASPELRADAEDAVASCPTDSIGIDLDSAKVG